MLRDEAEQRQAEQESNGELPSAATVIALEADRFLRYAAADMANGKWRW